MAELQARADKERRGTRPIEDSIATPVARVVAAPARALPAGRGGSSGAGRRASLARQTRSLQRSHGNQHVQRLIQRSSATKSPQPPGVAQRAVVQRKGAKVTLPDAKKVDRDTYKIESKNLEAVVMYHLNAGKEMGKGGIEDPAIEGIMEKGVAVEVNVTGRFMTRVPIWTKRDTRPAAEQKEWDRFLAALTKHENNHLAIAQRHVKGWRSLGGLKENDFNTRRDQKLQALEAEQEAYDVRTQHGIKEGATINLPESP